MRKGTVKPLRTLLIEKVETLLLQLSVLSLKSVYSTFSVDKLRLSCVERMALIANADTYFRKN